MALKNHAREALEDAPTSQVGEGSGEAPARALHLQAMMIAVAEIREDINNPRQRAAGEVHDAELLASVRELGVLQPVLVRPTPESGSMSGLPYTLVFGHRRLRASKEAGLEKIPAVIRDMSDIEVLEAQLVENAARAGVHPLDEGLAYVRLAEMGRTVDEIAAKVGKSRATIYARMKLCDLAPKVREAFEKGKIEASIALLLARVPTKSLQEEALRAITPQWADESISYKRAVQILHDSFMRQLKGAPFDPNDAGLVPAAGACSACPKRTGNQHELFGEVKSADVCTDTACFAKKAAAGQEQRKAQARELGQKVLDGKKGENALRSGTYRELDARCWADPKERTYRQLLGKVLKTPDVAGALALLEKRDEFGSRETKLVEVMEPKALSAAIKAAGHDFKRSGTEGTNSRTGRSTAMDRAHLVRKRIEIRVLEELVVAAPKTLDATVEAWRWLARAAMEASWHDTLKATVGRRGLEGAQKHERPNEILLRWLDSADTAGAQGLAIEILAGKSLHSLHESDRDGFSNQGARLACELAGIDLKKLSAAVKKEVEIDHAAKQERKKAREKKAEAKAKKGAKPDKSNGAT